MLTHTRCLNCSKTIEHWIRDAGGTLCSDCASNRPRNRPLTAGDLIAILQQYPADTPLLSPKHSDLFPRHVEETTVDDWEHTTVTADGELPGELVALVIGR